MNPELVWFPAGGWDAYATRRDVEVFKLVDGRLVSETPPEAGS